jgi:predicted naringenin-chalcone synthase
VTIPNTRDLITWDIGDSGFEMVLSGQVPGAILESLRTGTGDILSGVPSQDIALWGIHPGGRSVLDAVERAFGLSPQALAASRDVLRLYGNMSSPTVMFVMERLLRAALPRSRGCGMSFGPGLTAETFLFHAVE